MVAETHANKTMVIISSTDMTGVQNHLNSLLQRVSKDSNITPQLIEVASTSPHHWILENVYQQKFRMPSFQHDMVCEGNRVSGWRPPAPI